MWSIMADERPWGGLSKEYILRAIRKGERPTAIPHNTIKEYADLMEQCWDQDPLKRPCMPDVKVALEKMLSEGSSQSQKTD